jgi:hypothetical protein
MRRRIAAITLAALVCLAALLVEEGRDPNPDGKKLGLPVASAR